MGRRIFKMTRYRKMPALECLPRKNKKHDGGLESCCSSLKSHSESLRGFARDSGIGENVRFVGYLDRTTALLDCYRAAEALVFASRTETQGLVLLEAMALGVPVVSTAVMGTRDIVGPGKGALVAKDCERDFAANVVRLLGDPALRRRLAAEAWDYARTWSAPALALRLQDAYLRLVDAHRGQWAARAVTNT